MQSCVADLSCTISSHPNSGPFAHMLKGQNGILSSRLMFTAVGVLWKASEADVKLIICAETLILVQIFFLDIQILITFFKCILLALDLLSITLNLEILFFHTFSRSG